MSKPQPHIIEALSKKGWTDETFIENSLCYNAINFTTQNFHYNFYTKLYDLGFEYEACNNPVRSHFYIDGKNLYPIFPVGDLKDTFMTANLVGKYVYIHHMLVFNVLPYIFKKIEDTLTQAKVQKKEVAILIPYIKSGEESNNTYLKCPELTEILLPVDKYIWYNEFRGVTFRGSVDMTLLLYSYKTKLPKKMQSITTVMTDLEEVKIKTSDLWYNVIMFERTNKILAKLSSMSWMPADDLREKISVFLRSQLYINSYQTLYTGNLYLLVESIRKQGATISLAEYKELVDLVIYYDFGEAKEDEFSYDGMNLRIGSQRIYHGKLKIDQNNLLDYAKSALMHKSVLEDFYNIPLGVLKAFVDQGIEAEGNTSPFNNNAITLGIAWYSPFKEDEKLGGQGVLNITVPTFIFNLYLNDYTVRQILGATLPLVICIRSNSKYIKEFMDSPTFKGIKKYDKAEIGLNTIFRRIDLSILCFNKKYKFPKWQ